MGACKTKLKRNQNNEDKKENARSQNTNSTSKVSLAIQTKRQGIMQSNMGSCLNSPLSSAKFLSNRHQTKALRKSDFDATSQSQQGGLSMVINLNASKFYSQQKRQIHNNLNILQNNKNGLLVEMETLSKEDPQSSVFIEWILKSAIDHPNIIKLYEVFQTQDQYQVIYEHFDGIPLKNLIEDEETKVPKTKMAQIIDQILSAINYLHSINQIHGHLTPNCFRIQQKDDEITVKLIDIKKVIIKDIECEDFEELKFLPPECVNHPDKYTNARDIWAIGLMAYTLRKGRLPYDLPLQSENRFQQSQFIIRSHKFSFQKKKDKTYKSFLDQTLARDTKFRKSCLELLSHPFITKYKAKQIVPQTQLLKNLLHAKSCCLLQELLLGYFLQEFQWEEYIIIQKLFQEGDQDMDGLLNKEELLKLFNTYMKEETNIEQKIDELFTIFELNKVGGMNNQHFQTMTVNRQSLLTIGNIEICFEILSADKKEITIKNLKKHLNYESDDLAEEFGNLTNEVNRISLAQFQKLMKLLL